MDVTAAERVSEPVVFHGEGPFWDEQGSRLLFVDMLAGAVMSRDGGGAITRHPVPSKVASVMSVRPSHCIATPGKRNGLPVCLQIAA